MPTAPAPADDGAAALDAALADRPERFGPYTVFESLGEGGMASVHRAERDGWERNGVRAPIALKRLFRELTGDAQFVEAFLQEARLAKLLDHPNIARSYEHGVYDGQHFMAMEYVPGPTLRAIMIQSRTAAGAIPLRVVVEILLQLCDALAHAHDLRDEHGRELGLVHRDVTPANVIVSTSGIVKLIDFGIAKAAHSRVTTQAGFIKGKISYVAPEYTHGRLDHRADLFAVGVMAHELLTGRRLFDGRSQYSVVGKVRELPIHPPSHHAPNIPRDLDDVVMLALQRDPDKRWQNASAMRHALANVSRLLGARVTGKELRAWVDWAFAREPWRDSFVGRIVDRLDTGGSSPSRAAVAATAWGSPRSSRLSKLSSLSRSTPSAEWHTASDLELVEDDGAHEFDDVPPTKPIARAEQAVLVAESAARANAHVVTREGALAQITDESFAKGTSAQAPLARVGPAPALAPAPAVRAIPSITLPGDRAAPATPAARTKPITAAPLAASTLAPRATSITASAALVGRAKPITASPALAPRTKPITAAPSRSAAPAIGDPANPAPGPFDTAPTKVAPPSFDSGPTKVAPDGLLAEIERSALAASPGAGLDHGGGGGRIDPRAFDPTDTAETARSSPAHGRASTPSFETSPTSVLPAKVAATTLASAMTIAPAKGSRSAPTVLERPVSAVRAGAASSGGAANAGAARASNIGAASAPNLAAASAPNLAAATAPNVGAASAPNVGASIPAPSPFDTAHVNATRSLVARLAAVAARPDETAPDNPLAGWSPAHPPTDNARPLLWLLLLGVALLVAVIIAALWTSPFSMF